MVDLSRITELSGKLLQRFRKRSSSNFKFAFLFLRPDQREALKEVYEFCRVVDDIVDERPPGAEGERVAAEGLQEWREEIARIYEEQAPQSELGRRLLPYCELFSLPREGFDEIIEGCAMDLERSIYDDLEQLELYCYRVASCVGLLCIGIFGDQGEVAQSYARHLGLALQYTNILRDVAEDAIRGRVYVPRELLLRHGLTPEHIFSATYDARFIAVAKEFAEMAEREYQAAWRELEKIENRACLLPAEVMGRTYHEILVELRENNYNVFVQRPSLRRRDKLKAAAIAFSQTKVPSRFSLRSSCS